MKTILVSQPRKWVPGSITCTVGLFARTISLSARPCAASTQINSRLQTQTAAHRVQRAQRFASCSFAPGRGSQGPRRSLIATLLAISVILLAIPAFASDTAAVLATSRQRIESADFKVSGHLVEIKAGVRTNLSMTIKAHWFPGILRVMVQLGQGAEANPDLRQNILIEMRPDGENSVKVMHPGDAQPAAIPLDSHIGPGFDMEDFLEPQYFWPVQSLTENVKRGTHDCDLVTSKPGASDRTGYAEIRTWLDHTIGFPVYVEKTLKGSGTVKEFTYSGLRHDQGVWSAHQMEAKTQGQEGSTLLIIDRGTAKAHLTAADFSVAQLTHF